MVLSAKEKKYAIVTGAVLSAALVYNYAIDPLFARYNKINDEKQTQITIADNNRKLMHLQRDLKPAWQEMSQNLTNNDSEAMSQASRDVLRWGQSAGVYVSAIKPDRTTTENKFVVSSFHVTATGRLAAVSRFVWTLESAPVPMRVHEVQLKPRKEGTDDLEVQLSVSTLSLPAGSGGAVDATPAAAPDPKKTVSSRGDLP